MTVSAQNSPKLGHLPLCRSLQAHGAIEGKYGLPPDIPVAVFLGFNYFLQDSSRISLFIIILPSIQRYASPAFEEASLNMGISL